MREEWRAWQLLPEELAVLLHEYDVPAPVEAFEQAWCSTCPHSDDGDMCEEGGLILGRTDRKSAWLLEHFVDGVLEGRYCLRHPHPPRFREPACGDLFDKTR